MSSHEKHHLPPPEDGLPLIQKGDHRTPIKMEEGRLEQRKRRNPALRVLLAFLVCSTVLLGLASVHSPSFRQRFSCHNGMMGKLKAGVEFGGKSTPTAAMGQDAPQSPSDLIDMTLPNQVEENKQSDHRGGDAHHVGGALAAMRLRLGKREANSSSVPLESSSQTAQTADPDPDPTATPTSEPSSEPLSSVPSQTPEPSPTPSSSESKTSTTTTPQPPVKSTTTKGPEPTPTPTAPPPNTLDTTIYTTKPPGPPPTPKVIIETSTRTSNGQVVIVESTITVQPSATQPGQITESPRPPPTLQNAATRQQQEARGMMLPALVVGAMMGAVLLY